MDLIYRKADTTMLKKIFNIIKKGMEKNDNNDYTDEIEKNYSYYLEKWLATKDSHPDEKILALNAFIVFMKETEIKCKNMGKDYEIWFYNYLVKDNYMERRQDDLNKLVKNYDKLCMTYNVKIGRVPTIEKKLVKIIEQNPGILQTEIYNKFDEDMKSSISYNLSQMDKKGMIKRQKSGNTYSITTN